MAVKPSRVQEFSAIICLILLRSNTVLLNQSLKAIFEFIRLQPDWRNRLSRIGMAEGIMRKASGFDIDALNLPGIETLNQGINLRKVACYGYTS